MDSNLDHICKKNIKQYNSIVVWNIVYNYSYIYRIPENSKEYQFISTKEFLE